MIEIPLAQALKRSAQNKHNKWPDRYAENRLEPECWPELNPKFQLRTGSSIFTIGSCFARHIERYLHQFGFRIPTIEYLESLNGVGSEILNKYTPPAIYQDLAWTKRIRDRDDCVRMSDIDDFLITLENGNVRDLQRQFASAFGVSREDALADRRNYYQMFRQVFECDTVVITLGLIECWWDADTGQYVLFDNSLRKAGEGRFFFRRLDFAESYKFVKESLDLINSEGDKNILITTSPVPLNRTFTSEDVIVANSYSKSVLRAVAGQIAEQYENVDYFPSYESVMLTKQPYVWEPDLVHVESSFVGRIMLRVTDRYVADRHEQSLTDQILQMRSRAAAADWAGAYAGYTQLKPSELEHLDCVSHCSAAEICLHNGEFGKAGFHADRAMHLAQAAGEAGLDAFYSSWQVFKALGDVGKAESALSRLRERGRRYPVIFLWMLYTEMQRPGQQHKLKEFWQFMQDEFPQDFDFKFSVAALYRKERMFDEAETLVRRVLERTPTNLDFLVMLLDLLIKQDKRAAACETLDMILGIDPDNGDAEVLTRRWLEVEILDLNFLARLAGVLSKYKKTGKFGQILDRVLQLDPENLRALKRFRYISVHSGECAVAEKVSRLIVERQPDDIRAILLLAKVLRRMGEFEEAEYHAREALKVDPANQKLAYFLRQLPGTRTERGGALQRV
jgi:tetratricopeptide (TPR) repeat protein